MVGVDDPIRWHVLSADERDRLAASLRAVLPGHPWAKAAYLYGSAARRDRPARDVDLGIWADPVPADRAAETAIVVELGRRLPLPVEIDLRILNGASPVFLNNVLRDGQLLYDADPEARSWFEAKAMAQWLDFRPVYERIRREVLEGWSRG